MTMTKTTKRKIKDEYFYWLFHQIEERKNPEMEDFICDLHSILFYSIIPNDDNRVEDGLQLRNNFIYENPVTTETSLYVTCTVLEMLVALAQRMDFILGGSVPESCPAKWFWLFINNLKLQKYNDKDEDAERKRKVNKIILKKLIDRKYQPNGIGSLFPLDNPVHDQREVEIWYQMMDYISEKYDI
jgi:hypothetical protein